jgi:predicted transcriptional regulator
MLAMPTRQTPPPGVLARSFGPLELQVMEAVWQARRPATVRDLHVSFPECAYTTLMTTLDRLHKKGVLARTKVGRAFAYEPRYERHEMELRLAARSIEGLLSAGGGRRALGPVLSCFVDAVGERDRLLLDDLEKLLKEKRARLVRGGSR